MKTCRDGAQDAFDLRIDHLQDYQSAYDLGQARLAKEAE
jgi:hypothetical protein